MNILISSAGNKRALIEGFRSALSALSLTGRIIASDSRVDAPAAGYADAFVRQPLDSDENYAARWLALCREYDISLLVPTRDRELLTLSRLKVPLASAGVTVLVPAPDTISTCLDKRRFYEFCVANDFPVLSRVDHPSAADLPLFARSRFDAGSRSARALLREDDLAIVTDDLLVQPFCSRREFSIDALFSLGGEPLQAVVRERVEVVNGESVVTRLCDIPELSQLALHLGKTLSLTGPAVIQCFYDETEGPLLIECNPRFGGASMVSVAAGLDSCARVLLELLGERRRAFEVRPVKCGELVDRRRQPPGVVL